MSGPASAATDASGQGGGLPIPERRTKYSDPFKFSVSEQFDALMLETRAHQASDVFVQPGRPICARINGHLVAMMSRDLTVPEVWEILKWTTNRETAKVDMVSAKPINGRYELFDPVLRTSGGGRLRHGYRVNAVPVLCEGGTCAQVVIRAIPSEPPLPAAVGLGPEVLRGATPERGLVYVAGTTGSGKTTTFAALIRNLMEGDTPIKGNIVTYEDPIEFRFDMIRSAHSVCVQTQIPQMVPDFFTGVREAMRRNPALIMVGEARDQETIRACVEAALTGHPVYTTVHATDCSSIMRRLISRFPEADRATAIYDIVETARFLMAQRLVRTRAGGLTAAREYLSLDEPLRDQLMELTDMGKVSQAVKRLVDSHGHSFKKEAARLLAAGVIDDTTARSLAHT